MKIGMLVNNLEVSGGYQKLVIRLAQQLMRLKHEVIVYSPVVDKNQCYPDSIGDLNIVTIENGSNKPLSERFRELAQKVAPDTQAIIIHDELSLIAIACLPKTQIKSIVWMLNNQFPEGLGKYKAELTSIAKTKYVSNKDKRTDLINNANRIHLMKKGLRKITSFAVYDSFNGSLVEKHLGKKADFVAAGADLDQFIPLSKARKYIEKSEYTILSVGVLFPHRRYEDLILATKLLVDENKPMKTIIVGRQDLSPEYFTLLKNLTKELGVQKHVTFMNYVTDKEMTELYKKSDAFIFINDGFTWGISVFEAVAAGLPCVITDNIGAADLITNRKTGWIVKPQSPREVADAINDIVTDRKHTDSVAKEANKTLAEFVSWSAYTQRMLKLIKA
ncbi:MAG: group 1 glycosyl transferase [Candidatus Saccharibacteria bacterium]|nr:group 1 glycosyl transferase [Candidatus Saccharibacteria bacterium]